MDPTVLLAPMLKYVVKPLGSYAVKELAKIWKVEKEVDALLASYAEITGMLNNWEGGLGIDDSLLSKWLQMLEGHLYDAEDLVDYLTLISTTTDGTGEDKNPFRKSIFKYPSVEIWTTPHKLVALLKDLDEVRNFIKRASDPEQRNPEQLDQSALGRLLSKGLSFMHGTGRDKDKQSIIEELIKGQRSGVCIVGIDGLGKTSLARAIMVDETIRNHFPVVLHATVSGDFRMPNIVEALVANCLDTSPLPATEHLQNLLEEGRSLIIFDDLWSVVPEHWQRFYLNYLKLERNEGWKILITSPNREVAERTKSVVHDLGIMSNKECERLIVKSGELHPSEHVPLATHLDAVAEKCHGLPIIANKLGLELFGKQNIHAKKDRLVELKKSNLHEMDEFREMYHSINSRVLNMTLDLTRCFAYCALFPLDHEFNRDELIQCWEAEGFIQPRDPSLDSKISARNKCFDAILSRSILHPSKSSDNEPPLYKMLAFSHWFAQILASRAFCLVNEGTPSDSLSSCKQIRHLCLTVGQHIPKSLLEKIEECKGLRTFRLLHQQKQKPSSIPYDFFEKLPALRLLDLSHAKITALSNHPAALSIHLRYLDLSNSLLTELPNAIKCVRALQVLKLRNCSKLFKLPKELSQLLSLTHLHFDVRRLNLPPSDMGNLTNLEVLESFFVGKDEGCKVSELKNMKNLSKLYIFGLGVIRDKAEADGAMLNDKPRLNTLALEWDPNVEAETAEEVFKGLQPHEHLKDLEVRNYGGKSLPEWLVSTTFQIVSILLDDCPNCEDISSLGQLPLLRNLVLSSVGSVTTLDNELRGEGEKVFPRLELLELRSMELLDRWTGLQERDMPFLRDLRIKDCPVLSILPSFAYLHRLVYLEMESCPALQLPLPELPFSLQGGSGILIIEHISARYQPTNEQDQDPMDENQSSTSNESTEENNVLQGAPMQPIRTVWKFLKGCFSCTKIEPPAEPRSRPVREH